MASARNTLALAPLAALRRIDATRAAPSTFRAAHAFATLFPHVDAAAVDPVTIGGPPLGRLDGHDTPSAGFDTHWTRMLHNDLFARPVRAPCTAAPAAGTQAMPTGVATRSRREASASRPIATAHAPGAPRHGSANEDSSREDHRMAVVVPAVRDWPVGSEATNDASVRARETERRARNALARMRLAYAGPESDAAGRAAPSVTPSHNARRARVGERFHAAVDAIVAFTRDVLARRQRRLKARAICDALWACDDRTLRDLGMHRSEIMSLAAEASGAAPCTRERVHRLRRGPR